MQSGKAAVNGWLAIPSGFSAEVMAQCGWDSVTVDMQHGVQDYQSMVQCFQAMTAHPITPLVRVPWNEPGIIGKVLDGGAWGVICPMVNNRAEAQASGDACLYPPAGKRSNGPIRAAMYGEASNYQKTANDEVLVIPMIETQEGIDNIDEILSRARHQRHLYRSVRHGPVARHDSDPGSRGAGDPWHLREAAASCKHHGKFAGLHNGTAAYAGADDPDGLPVRDHRQ